MIIYSLGFLFCLGLLFYFIAKYKESDLPDEEFLCNEDESKKSSDIPEENAQEQLPEKDPFVELKEETNTVQQVQRLFAKADSLPAREIFDLKDKVKDLSYILEGNRLLEEKHYNELKTSLSKLEKRLSSFENEYLNNLHPTLTTLIKELENLQDKKTND